MMLSALLLLSVVHHGVPSGLANELPRQQGLLDARTVIRQITANDPEAKIELAEKVFANHLREFCDRKAMEGPAKVARGWLDLAYEAVALPRRSMSGGLGGMGGMRAGSLANVLILLPPPETWPEIRRLVAQQPPSSDRTALQILCARLMGDDAEVVRLCKQYDAEAPKGRGIPDRDQSLSVVRIAAMRRLDRLTSESDFLAAFLADDGRHEDCLTFTDLLPKPMAKDLMFRLLKRDDLIGLDFLNRENQKLAREVILEHPGESLHKPRSLGDVLDLVSVRGLGVPYRTKDLIAQLERSVAGSNQALIQESVARLLKQDRVYVGPDLLHELLANGRFGLAENLTTKSLIENLANVEVSNSEARDLCAVYFRANRPKDILTVLDEFPNWSKDDLSKMHSSDLFAGHQPESGRADKDEQPVSYYAAWALWKTGRTNLATRILRNLLLGDWDLSAAYDLLNQIGGVSALPVYNDVITAHPFAPWPYLWKGDLLCRFGRIREAEFWVRTAAALEPRGGDGYQRKLYGSLEQILKRTGDAHGARRCEDLEAALAMFPNGWGLPATSVLPQAQAYIEKALSICPKEAELEAELADCLELEGKLDESRTHRILALQYLPACIGENSPPYVVSSMLTEPKFEALARETLLQTVAKNPNDAEAHFCLGLVNFNAGHSREALAEIEKVVHLDPRHVTAWEMIGSLGRWGIMSAAELQEAEFKLIALNEDEPVARRKGVDLTLVSDLAHAYREIQARLKTLPLQDDGPLYKLHSLDHNTRPELVPRFNRLEKRGQLVGWYFQSATDIAEIARLYHPTNDPY